MDILTIPFPAGNNPGCNTNGFPAKAGWDPVRRRLLGLILLRLTLKSPGDGFWFAQFRRVEKGGGLVTEGACARVRYDFFDVRCLLHCV